MNHGEWRLIYPGTDYLFGTRAQPVWNLTTPEVGNVETRVAHFERPRQDGRAFGTDYLSGQSIAFELGVRGSTSADVRDELSRLTSAWRARTVRQTPGAVAELRMNYDGRERVVYGRPRRFGPPDLSEVSVNRLATVPADFACSDDLFYSPTEEAIEFGFGASSTEGGLTAPLTYPMSTTASSDRSQGVTIDTDEPVWPVVTLYGPITDATITIGFGVQFDVRLSLLDGEEVVIDARPWKRSSIRNGYTSVAGSVRGTMLANASLPAGDYNVALHGTDPTGTARMRLAWQRAYASL